MRKICIYILCLTLFSFTQFMFALADIQHQVMPKETLSSIARKYGVPVKSILEKNSIDDPDKIKVGQILIIPLEEKKPYQLTYEVKQGDTLSSISRKYALSLQELMDANSIKNNESIKNGQTLIIPTGFTIDGPIHEIKQGETLCSIAHDYGVSVLALSRANSIGDPNKLRAGRLLVIPPKDETLQSENKTGQEALIAETVVDLRAKPEKDSEVVTQTILGDKVSIKEVSGDWYFIENPDGYFGWVESSSLAELNEKTISSSTVIVSALIADILTSPSCGSECLDKAVMGTNLLFIKKEGNWVQVMLPKGQMGWIMEGQVIFRENPPQPADKIIETAEMYKDVPYLWGGTTSLGVDCSGFVFTVYKMNGYKIPRNAESQYNYCEKKDDADLKPGDLVFFTTYMEGPSHVGIYLGNKNFIHASSSHGVTVSSLEQDYYKSRYLGGGRIKEIVN